MSRLGSSNIPIGNMPIANTFIGATGSTGPTGPTGPTGGNNGATGATGLGVAFITKIDANGITVHLIDGTKISVTGLSGNTPTDFSGLVSTNPFDIKGATGVDTNAFSIISNNPVTGLTAYFKSIAGSGGLSLTYSGDNLVFKGVTGTSSNALGVSGTVLYALGNTANALLDRTGNRVFRYQTVTSGSTTAHLASALMGSFLQGKNTAGITNVNLINITGLTALVTNPWDSSVNSFYKSGNTWTSNQIYHTSYKGVTGTNQNSGITYISSDIFNDTNTTTYQNKIIGSCCYCNSNGAKTCLDYITRYVCETNLSGNFSANPCIDRRTQDCDDFGACCINGTCVDTNRTVCLRYGGVFDSATSCSANPPPC